MPKVSVNLITYNRVKYLKSAIESVLAQSFIDWEMVIVDDCSSDDTSSLIKEFQKNDARLKYFKNDTNLGIGKSRNHALELSRGEYVAVLDSDDVWFDVDKLRKQINFFENNKDIVLVGGGVSVIDEKGVEQSKYLNPVTDRQIRQQFLLRNPFAHSSAIFSKVMALKAGEYDVNLIVGEDFDLFLKIGKLGKMANLPDYLVSYRKHGTGITWAKSVRAAVDHINIIKKHKNEYPNFYLAIIKGYLRLILSWVVSPRI